MRLLVKTGGDNSVGYLSGKFRFGYCSGLALVVAQHRASTQGRPSSGHLAGVAGAKEERRIPRQKKSEE